VSSRLMAGDGKILRTEAGRNGVEAAGYDHAKIA
jgi:hypothetical protein